MKKLLFILCFFLINIGLSLGQSFTCNNGTFDITSVTCDAGLLTFSVTNTNPSGCSSYISLSAAADVTINGNKFDGLLQFFIDNGTSTISITTPNCEAVAMVLNYSGENCTNCTPGTFLLTGPPAPIPTMGEWSLFILWLMLSIGGIVAYKSKPIISKLATVRSND